MKKILVLLALLCTISINVGAQQSVQTINSMRTFANIEDSIEGRIDTVFTEAFFVGTRTGFFQVQAWFDTLKTYFRAGVVHSDSLDSSLVYSQGRLPSLAILWGYVDNPNDSTFVQSGKVFTWNVDSAQYSFQLPGGDSLDKPAEGMRWTFDPDYGEWIKMMIITTYDDTSTVHLGDSTKAYVKLRVKGQ